MSRDLPLASSCLPLAGARCIRVIAVAPSSHPRSGVTLVQGLAFRAVSTDLDVSACEPEGWWIPWLSQRARRFGFCVVVVLGLRAGCCSCLGCCGCAAAGRRRRCDGNGGGAMAAAAGRCSARCFGSRALLRACVHSAFERVCVRARARASMCACVRVRASSRCYFVVNAPARQPSREANQSCGRFFCRAPLPAPRRVPAQALERRLRRRRWPLLRQQG